MELEATHSKRNALFHPGESGRLNYLELASSPVGSAGEQSGSAPTKRQLLELLQQAEHVRIFSTNESTRQEVEREINALDKGDLKTIGDIVTTLKTEPFNKEAMDKVLQPYECFPERLRNLLNSVDLVLQREGIDLRHDSPEHRTFGVDGGYDNYPTDQSSYTLSIKHDREKPFYQYKFGSACS
jgi:hypothetical protein